MQTPTTPLTAPLRTHMYTNKAEAAAKPIGKMSTQTMNSNATTTLDIHIVTRLVTVVSYQNTATVVKMKHLFVAQMENFATMEMKMEVFYFLKLNISWKMMKLFSISFTKFTIYG